MKKTRVLIVDDDPDLSRLSAIILESTGEYEVAIEQDSTHALAVARQFKPHIMLLDADAPNNAGGDLVREAANDPLLGGLPVLLVRGLPSEVEARVRDERGARVAILLKPVLPETLLASVRQLVERVLTP
jgi:DNA-binding response OmpR family regulator